MEYYRMNSKNFHRQFFCLQLTDAITWIPGLLKLEKLSVIKCNILLAPHELELWVLFAVCEYDSYCINSSISTSNFTMTLPFVLHPISVIPVSISAKIASIVINPIHVWLAVLLKKVSVLRWLGVLYAMK